MKPTVRLVVRTAAVLLFIAVRHAAAADDSLVRAAAAGDMKTVRAILQQGHDPGNVDVRAGDGSTALHWAVRAEDIDTTNALLRAGAKVSAVNALGVTPAYLAAESGNAA